MNGSAIIALVEREASVRNAEAVTRAFAFDIPAHWKHYCATKSFYRRHLHYLTHLLNHSGGYSDQLCCRHADATKMVEYITDHKPTDFRKAIWRMYLRRAGMSTIGDLHEVH